LFAGFDDVWEEEEQMNNDEGLHQDAEVELSDGSVYGGEEGLQAPSANAAASRKRKHRSVPAPSAAAASVTAPVQPLTATTAPTTAPPKTSRMSGRVLKLPSRYT